MRRTAVGALLGAYGRALPEEQLRALYEESGVKPSWWWSEEHRGYTTNDRLRWILERAAVKPREPCEHVATAADAGGQRPPHAAARDARRCVADAARVRRHFRLAIVSDTGFASGRAQDRLLEKDAARAFFAATIYSMDIGTRSPARRSSPRRSETLGVAPNEILHIGDNERTTCAARCRPDSAPCGWTWSERADRAKPSSWPAASRS